MKFFVPSSSQIFSSTDLAWLLVASADTTVKYVCKGCSNKNALAQNLKVVFDKNRLSEEAVLLTV